MSLRPRVVCRAADWGHTAIGERSDGNDAQCLQRNCNGFGVHAAARQLANSPTLPSPPVDGPAEQGAHLNEAESTLVPNIIALHMTGAAPTAPPPTSVPSPSGSSEQGTDQSGDKYPMSRATFSSAMGMNIACFLSSRHLNS